MVKIDLPIMADSYQHRGMVVSTYKVDKLHILLVEDNPGDVALIREALIEVQGNAFELTAVARLDKALEWLKEVSFDVVLLDLGLPDSQGVETFEHLLSCVIDVPVLVLTAHDDDDFGELAVRKGAHDYLVKSYTTGRTLMRAIRYAIDRHQVRIALSAQLRDLQAVGGQLNQLLNSNTDGLVLVDFEGLVRYVNRAAAHLLARPFGELLGKPFVYDVTLGDRFEVEKTRSDGQEIVLDLQVMPTEWNGVAAQLVTMRDITQRKADEALRVLSETAGAAAHEINQPLTVVVGKAELLLNQLADDHPMRSQVEAILRAGISIGDIVSKMGDTKRYVIKRYLGNVDIVDFDAAVKL